MDVEIAKVKAKGRKMPGSFCRWASEIWQSCLKQILRIWRKVPILEIIWEVEPIIFRDQLNATEIEDVAAWIFMSKYSFLSCQIEGEVKDCGWRG